MARGLFSTPCLFRPGRHSYLPTLGDEPSLTGRFHSSGSVFFSIAAHTTESSNSSFRCLLLSLATSTPSLLTIVRNSHHEVVIPRGFGCRILGRISPPAIARDFSHNPPTLLPPHTLASLALHHFQDLLRPRKNLLRHGQKHRCHWGHLPSAPDSDHLQSLGYPTS